MYMIPPQPAYHSLLQLDKIVDAAGLPQPDLILDAADFRSYKGHDHSAPGGQSQRIYNIKNQNQSWTLGLSDSNATDDVDFVQPVATGGTNPGETNDTNDSYFRHDGSSFIEGDDSAGEPAWMRRLHLSTFSLATLVYIPSSVGGNCNVFGNIVPGASPRGCFLRIVHDGAAIPREPQMIFWDDSLNGYITGFNNSLAAGGGHIITGAFDLRNGASPGSRWNIGDVYIDNNLSGVADSVTREAAMIGFGNAGTGLAAAGELVKNVSGFGVQYLMVWKDEFFTQSQLNVLFDNLDMSARG